MTTTVQAALDYAALGYPVLPCNSGLKSPATSNGFLAAVTDAEKIHEWWTANPDYNVALATAGVLVVDLDTAEHPWSPGPWPEGTPTSRTPRGGMHLYFRKPEGKRWRCSSKQLADEVDIRTDGGYALEFPSTTADGEYQWIVPLRRPEELPDPPAWLVAALDCYHDEPPAAETPATAAELKAGDDFNSRGTWAETGLFDAGWKWDRQTGDEEGHMTRPGKGMGTSATVGICKSKKKKWPLFFSFTGGAEPIPSGVALSRFAVLTLLKHGGDYGVAARSLGDQGYGGGKKATTQAKPKILPYLGPLPQFRSVDEMSKNCPHLRPSIIRGLLREGETLNVIAPPKTGKSWLVNDLALSVATGRPWLGMDVTKGGVLILDNELHIETSANRIPQVAEARGIELAEYASRLHVDNLRGRLQPLSQMEAYFASLEVGQFKVVVLDAWYRFVEEGRDENDNGAMTAMYNLIDRFADRLGCAFVCIHHTSKGNQSGRSVTDVGSGAGAQSRAADSHMVIRPHQEHGCVVVEAVARSWPPPKAFCLRWDFPVWHRAEDLNPLHLAGGRVQTSPGGGTGVEATVEAVLDIVREKQPIGRDSLIEDVRKVTGLSTTKAKKLFSMAVEQKLIVNTVKAANKPNYYTLPDYASA